MKSLHAPSLYEQRCKKSSSRCFHQRNKTPDNLYILCVPIWKVLYVGVVLRSVAHVFGVRKRETCVRPSEFCDFRTIWRNFKVARRVVSVRETAKKNDNSRERELNSCGLGLSPQFSQRGRTEVGKEIERRTKCCNYEHCILWPNRFRQKTSDKPAHCQNLPD